MISGLLLSLLIAADADPGTALAQRVHEAAGGRKLREVAELRFNFVVMVDGEKKSDVRHRWDLRGSRDRVTWTDRQGVSRDVIVDLTKKPEGEASDEAKAYARWINDSYWLILPLKRLDPGVIRTREDDRPWNGKTYQILRLEFQKVGLTPGDRYWLFIDPKTARIERWEMVLEGQKPPAEGFSFEEYQAVGPLALALDHVSDDKKKHIKLESVEALTAVEAKDFVK
jgi:hypothetical protein